MIPPVPLCPKHCITYRDRYYLHIKLCKENIELYHEQKKRWMAGETKDRTVRCCHTNLGRMDLFLL